MSSSLQEKTANSTRLTPSELLESWRASAGRPRDVAARLGVPECALLQAAALTDSGFCTWLDPTRVRDVLMQLPALGQVMALTRNHAVVHEKVGTYGAGDLGGHVGLIINDGIDLRLFLRHWRHMIAVADCKELGLRASLQWFDGSGAAVHKVFLRPESDRIALDAIAASARSPQAAASVVFKDYPPASNTADAAVDRERLLSQWSQLQDTHDFQGLLRQHRVGREQALGLAPPEFAHLVANAALESTLDHVAAIELPIMVFVRNRGCVQIHGGKVERIESMNGWLNILDPGFNLHVRRGAIARTWVVRKPTRHGIISALEAYDADGDLVLTLFGARPADQPEPEPWRSWLDQLGDAMPPC